jgi:archaellum biogenesis ATPase FlaH
VQIPKEIISAAKAEMGEKAALLIATELQLKEFDEKDLKSICPFHTEDTGSFIWHSSKNSFHCFGECGINYDIVDHYMQFHQMTYLQAIQKLFDETNTNYQFGERGVRTNRDYRYPSPVDSGKRDQVEKYLGFRKISSKTLDYAGIAQDEKGNCVFHYWDTNDVLTAVKYRPSHKFVKGNDKSKYWGQENADNSAGTLYLINMADPSKPLVITEGEIDCLTVIESGWTNCVSIPSGAGQSKDNWIEQNYELLETFDNIIIWFDNDTPGIISRKDACARLGTWKTRFVNLPVKMKKEDGADVGVKDANEVLFHFGKKVVLDYIRNAEEVPVPNVTDLANVDDFDIETAPGLVTSLKNINDIVYKFIYGSLVILTGKRGHGKSVLLNQIFVCDALESGEDVFIYSGELGTSVLKSWIECPLIGRENIVMKNDFVRKFDEKAKKEMRDWYRGRIWAYDDLNNDVEQILNRAINITRKYGAKIWIIDNLMSLDIGITGEGNQWIKQKELVVKLVSLALTYGVLIVLVGHPRKTSSGFEVDRRLSADDVAGSGDIGNISHYILSVHRYSKAERAGEADKKNGGFRKGKEPIPYDVVIDVLKNRYTGKLEEAQEYFDFPSYRFYSTSKELFRRYAWNKSVEPLRTDDPNNHESEHPIGFGE